MERRRRSEGSVTGGMWGLREREGSLVRMACGFPVWATAWVVVPFTKTGHTEAPLPKSNLHLFLSVSV